MSTVVIANDSAYMDVYNALLATKEASAISEFTKTVRSGNGNGFEEGDVISLPNEIRPLEVPIAGSTTKAQALLVKVTDATNSVRYQLFYPSSLAKRTVVCDVDSNNNPINKVPRKPDGDAAKWYQERAGKKVMDVMKEMVTLGKDIKVTMKKSVKQPVYNGTGVTDTNIYNFSFA